MAGWSRPDIQNAVRELSRHGSAPNEAHIKAMYISMEYVRSTPERGWYLNPSREWDDKDKEFKFVIRGCTDSDYAKCPTTRRSVSGNLTFLGDASIIVRSLMQKLVALSVTEAETVSGVQCA